jgi:general secretion pathway protein E
MRLGEILIERRLITEEDLARALEIQRERSGDKIGKILVDLGFIAARDVLAALSEQLQIPVVALDGPPAVSPETESLAPKFLRQFRCLPVALHDHTITLAMADPLDYETRSAVQACTGLNVQVGLAPEQEILDAIDRYYGQQARTETEMSATSGEADEDLEHLRDMASEAPVIRLVNAMVAQAVEKRASDIHIEPFEKEFRVRYRIDGVLVGQESPPRELKAAIISRVKLMAKLNIAERRLPQDGRFRARVHCGARIVAMDFRISVIPGYYGENVVIRILDPRSAPESVEALGLAPAITASLQPLIRSSAGILLVTGPTGSGKSTTLFGMLKSVYRPEIKVVTAEDPIEYVCNDFSQHEVDVRVGNTFASTCGRSCVTIPRSS